MCMQPLNNPIWVMSSAFKKLRLPEIIDKTKEMGAQGIDLCVFRHDGPRKDHVATHLDYEHFTLDDARRTLETFNTAGLKLSIGAFGNLIGGDAAERRKIGTQRAALATRSVRAPARATGSATRRGCATGAVGIATVKGRRNGDGRGRG